MGEGLRRALRAVGFYHLPCPRCRHPLGWHFRGWGSCLECCCLGPRLGMRRWVNARG
jgi:hypothetical protein